MDLREQLDTQLAWGNEAERRIAALEYRVNVAEKERGAADEEAARLRWALEYTWIWMVEHHATPSMSRAAWFRYVEERRQMHCYDEEEADDNV